MIRTRADSELEIKDSLVRSVLGEFGNTLTPSISLFESTGVDFGSASLKWTALRKTGAELVAWTDWFDFEVGERRPELFTVCSKWANLYLLVHALLLNKQTILSLGQAQWEIKK